VVDAQEGPMPQTRFVLKKSLELGLKPIVVINKIDKPAADARRVHDEVFELFLELGANDTQLDFKTIYAIGRDGVAMKNVNDERKDLTPLLELILEEVPIASGNSDKPFAAQVFNLGYDNFLGRLAIARVYAGTAQMGAQIIVKKPDNEARKSKITKLYTFQGIAKKDAQEIIAGDIAIIAGIPDVYIGETIVLDENVPALPAIAIDEPTISLDFIVNDSPFAGREGKFVTSRQIRERLERELEINVGLKVDFSSAEALKVYGRGELHISVLLENMRREGYELQVSQPHVIVKEVDGVKCEPYEEVIIDVKSESASAVIEKLTRRRGLMMGHTEKDGIVRLVFEIPTRGLLGYRGEFIIDTKGEGIMSSRFIAFRPHAGEIRAHELGSMTSMVTGKAVAFALGNLQERGTLYIGHGTEVFEGMVIGNVTKGEEMSVNPSKGKQLTNMRASGTDETIYLKPAYTLTIERGLEIMGDDEYLEITPKSVRLRKKYLTELDRSRALRTTEKPR
jgi:GTP-binding protein